jgi:hypothetical protein
MLFSAAGIPADTAVYGWKYFLGDHSGDEKIFCQIFSVTKSTVELRFYSYFVSATGVRRSVDPGRHDDMRPNGQSVSDVASFTKF